MALHTVIDAARPLLMETLTIGERHFLTTYDRNLFTQVFWADPVKCQVGEWCLGTPAGWHIQVVDEFLNELMDEYEVAFSGCRNALFRMKENWTNLHDRFEDSDKLWKKMRKTTDAAEFRRLSSELLHTCPMK